MKQDNRMPDYTTQRAEDMATEVLDSGLTRREEFAKVAIQGLMSNNSFDLGYRPDKLSEDALSYADALIEQLYGADNG